MVKQYIVDALTDKLLSGNPAAVCVVSDYPEDALMLSIAKENNFSETAFIKRLDAPGTIICDGSVRGPRSTFADTRRSQARSWC